MKLRGKKITALVMAAILSVGATGCGSEKDSAEGFEPKLDTEKEVTLEISGFMGNFEALDQVVNNFNEIYPNVTITYEQNTVYMLEDYVQNNQGIDIIMTTDGNIQDASVVENYVGNDCLDLSKEGIDFSDISPEMISYCTVDGQLLRVPITKNPCGIVVKKTLLEKEDLSVPENYQEFIDMLSALKEKGYNPIEGAANHVYAEIAMNMAMNLMHSDDTLVDELRNGDEAAAEKMLPVFEKLETMIKEGYTDYETNAEYPSDNYDASILSFFEGDMPFWVCNAESFSGMKKRESKSETYSANPFEYEFMYVPWGEKGVYAYEEPWYGFSVIKDSDVKDYAVEFIRFLMTEEESDVMASIKGMPSVAVNAEDERYPGIHDIKNLEASFENDGSIGNDIREVFTQVCTDFGAGTYSNAQEAAEAFVQGCSTLD